MLSFAAPPARSQALEDAQESAPKAQSPWGGSVLLETSIGRGTLTTHDDDRRPLWAFVVNVAPTFTIDAERDLVVGLSLDASVNAIENADSANTTPHQIQPGDLLVTGRLGALVDLRERAGFSMALDGHLAAPTSRYSQFAGKILSARTGTSATWEPLRGLSLGGGIGYTKHFFGATNATLELAEFDAPPLGRSGGAERLADGLLAVSGNLTSFAVDYSTSASWSPLDALTLSCRVDIVQAWTLAGFPDDSFTSPNADVGRGQTDLMYGTLEASWAAHQHLSIALGTVTEQEPKSGDNERFRVPLWDFTNGAANRQVFYLDIIASL